MGGQQSIHAKTHKALEEQRTTSLKAFQDRKIKAMLDANLIPNLSKAATVSTVDEMESLVGADGKKVFASMSDAARGDHVQPAEDGRVTYERCIDRVHNKDAWAFPFAIVRVACAADVSAVVKFAADNSIPVSVMGGGNSPFSIVSETITIDMYQLRECTYDVDAQRVTVGGGALISHLEKALAPHLRHVPTGMNPSLGVSGVVLGGGLGWLSSRDGMPCDSLCEIEIVTADGSIIVATPENDHKDLLIACRGGGGQFGVVTKFTFETYAVPNDGKVLYGQVVPMAPTQSQKIDVFSNFVSMVETWRTEGRDQDRQAMCVLLSGAPVVPIMISYFGPLEVDGKKGLAAVSDIEATSTKLGGLFTAQTKWEDEMDYYTGLQQVVVEHQKEGFGYIAQIAINAFTPELIKSFVTVVGKCPNKLCAVMTFPFLGKALAGSDQPCAVPNPRAKYVVVVEGKWDPMGGPKARAATVEWVDKIRECFSKHSVGETSHPMSDVKASPTEAPPMATSQPELLLAVKQRYDPANMWQFNRRIK